MKLSPGLNFVNICMHSFYARSSQKQKNSVKLSVSFYALGSTGAKAARRMLMKLSPETNILDLVSQGDAVVEVERLDRPRRGAVVILRAPHRRQVDLVARFLRYLEKHNIKLNSM